VALFPFILSALNENVSANAAPVREQKKIQKKMKNKTLNIFIKASRSFVIRKRAALPGIHCHPLPPYLTPFCCGQVIE
jgi:hypothetical protein